MKAGTQLKDEIISTKIEESIAFRHNNVDLKFSSTEFPLRDCLECVEASCFALSYEMYRPRRSVSEATEDGKVIQTRRTHQREVCHALWELLAIQGLDQGALSHGMLN